MTRISGSGGSNRLAKTAGIGTIADDHTLAFATGSDRLEIDARGQSGSVQLIVAGSGPTYSGNFTWGGGTVAYSGVKSFTVHSSPGDLADEVRTGGGDDVFYHYGFNEAHFQVDIVDLGGGANDLLVADFSAVTGSAVSNGLHPDSGSYFLFEVAGNDRIAYSNVERLHFIGGAQGDTVSGHEGGDILEGRAGDDILYGSAGDDDISGGTGTNHIDAGDDDDIIRSIGFGVDIVHGGDGDDTAMIDYSALTSTVSNLYDGEVAFGDGTDTRVELTSVERIVIATGSAGDSIATQSGNDEIRTGAGGDVLDGAGGDDYLDGGAGIDAMIGGNGDDTFVVDEAGDSVLELAAGGIDQVLASSATYRLADQVEDLIAIGGGDRQFRANARDNRVSGAAGRDTLLLQDGGTDFAFGHGGDDLFYFGNAYSPADRADGGSGRDVVVLQGNYALTLGASSLNGIESVSLQGGANARWGDTAGNFYDYDLAVADDLLAAGQQLIVNGQSLRAGEDFAFDGSAETNGKFLIYGGHGVDTLIGGDGGDVFFFEGSRWNAADTVDGGDGRDSMILSGPSGTNRYVFGADSFTNIESISLNARFASDPTQKPAYELVLHSANVAAGATLIINASSLATFSQWVRVDGTAIQDGNLILFGGVAHDNLYGGGGDDLFVGGPGADLLVGQGGNDIFRYDSPSHSGTRAIDTIVEFLPGEDLIDLSRIDANSHEAGDQAFHWIGSDAFTGAGASSAGELRASLEFNNWMIRGDTNGDGAADFAIAVFTGLETLIPGPADFLL
ncbi:MAG TPA: M10 family metallopeptidase C-terminal domain-containing protein [Allosphingosinicella sp.]|jgi:Ca2+-binding RTX toxin-like protein